MPKMVEPHGARRGGEERETEEAAGLTLGASIESAKRRCRAAIDRINSLSSKSSSKITDSCKRTLLRYAHSELSFLSRFGSTAAPPSLSVNVGHLEAVLYILQQSFINGISRVCNQISLSPPARMVQKTSSCWKVIHVDIVCTVNGNPAWFIVSDRNPKFISWNGSSRNKSLRARIEQILDAALSSSASKPSSVILFFSHGLDDSIHAKLKDEFGAFKFDVEFSDFDFDFAEELEGEWIYILQRSFRQASVVEIKVDHSRDVAQELEYAGKDSVLGVVSMEQGLSKECMDLSLGVSFCSLISRMVAHSLGVNDVESNQQKDFSGGTDLINFDTTALIAIISGISNGSTKKLLAKPEHELKNRFKSNFGFVLDQVASEIQNPIHIELDSVLSGKRGLICASVCSEFKELVSMCGGVKEKSRAYHLLKVMKGVPDGPSERMMDLPTTRKLAMKNKIVFGTGDRWGAPTLTANMAFVRAVAQTGMSLYTIEHRPRALTGD